LCSNKHSSLPPDSAKARIVCRSEEYHVCRGPCGNRNEFSGPRINVMRQTSRLVGRLRRMHLYSCQRLRLWKTEIFSRNKPRECAQSLRRCCKLHLHQLPAAESRMLLEAREGVPRLCLVDLSCGLALVCPIQGIALSI
jgi:hypothetical protein